MSAILIDTAQDTIHTMRIEIDTQRAMAEGLQQRCSQLFHRQLRADVANVMRRVGGRLPVVIDRVVIDVGLLDAKDFERQLMARVLPQLEEQLRFWLNAQPRSVDDAPGTVYDTNSVRDTADGDADPTDRPVTAVAAFIRYLETGYFSRLQVWPAGPGPWLLAQCEATPELWRPWLADACLRPRSLARLCAALDATTLRALARWFNADDAHVPSVPAVGTTRRHLFLQASALYFLVRHPELPAPAIDTLPRVDAVEPALVPWFEALCDAPPSPLIDAWLSPLSTQPALRAQLAALPAGAECEEALRARLAAGEPVARRHTRPDDRRDDGRDEGGDEGGEEGRATRAGGGASDPPATERLTPLPARRDSRGAPARPADRIHSAGVTGEPLAVSNAGVVMLWPLLPGLLTRLGLVERGAFVSDEARLKAVCWLDELVWGDGATAEWRTPLTKLLCGLPLDTLLAPWQVLQPDTVERLETWLAAVPAQLPGLQRLAVADLRSLFLQRAGELRHPPSDRFAMHWMLEVERDPADVLAGQLPWPMTQVLLPWLERPLPVIWLP
ncbi:hypothetical protein DIE19_28655 [Burkholderia sp. Bp9126]|nr:hypothetical protein DIE19_28655 [Burkholderia sp. Bp9126]